MSPASSALHGSDLDSSMEIVAESRSRRHSEPRRTGSSSGRFPVDFLIIGSQRSGTTLMRLILDSHRHIACFDEQSAARLLTVRRLSKQSGSLIGLKAPQITEQLCDKRLRDDAAIRSGAAGWPNRYSGQKLIFLVRDVKACVGSMLTLRGWLDKYAVSVLEAKIRRDKSFRTRYAKEIELRSRSRNSRVASAALIWRYKTEALFDYLALGYSLLPVKYETLVKNPRPQLARVCRFLGVEWQPRLLAHNEYAHNDLEPNGLAIGGTDPTRPINRRSLTSWRRVLTSHEIRVIMSLAGSTQNRLYPRIRWRS